MGLSSLCLRSITLPRRCQVPDVFWLLQYLFRSIVIYAVGTGTNNFSASTISCELVFPDPGIVLRSVMALDFALFDSWGYEIVVWRNGTLEPDYFEGTHGVDAGPLILSYPLPYPEGDEVYIYGICYLLSNSGADPSGPIARYVSTYPIRGNAIIPGF